MSTYFKTEPTRICKTCGKKFQKNKKFSQTQWSQNKYCSRKCSAELKKIRDGMTRQERHRRKRGQLKRSSPEWIERIRATTTDAMKRPEIKAKITQPKGPMSVEERVKRSNALAGTLPKNMMFGSDSYMNIHRGDYENSKGTMYFRSRWEANYALYLDFLVKQKQIEGWSYETDVFVFDQIQFGTRSYRPDFKVFNNDGSFEYHEVKGYMDSKSKTKLKRMAKYYPEIKLVLIDSRFYNDLKKKVGKLLHFYE